MDLVLKNPGESNVHIEVIEMARPKTSKGRRILSEYALQLQEKQKAKLDYGLRERQLNNYYHLSSRYKGNTTSTLLRFLEQRLDNVIFRLGFAQSRRQARQFVSHKHVLVNGKVVNIPSFQIQPKDKIEIQLKNFQPNKEIVIPKWLSLDKSKNSGQVLKTPKQEEIITDLDMEKIIEFYSR